MKIRITDIGPDGLKVNDTIPLEPLNLRMNEASSNDIIFTSKPSVNLIVHKTPHGAQVKGTARALYTQPCAMCIKELDREAEVSIDYVFQRRTPLEFSNNKSKKEDKFSGDDFSDDIGICYFSGEHIELEDIIQESLILSLDQYYRPPSDSSGNCSKCGFNNSL